MGPNPTEASQNTNLSPDAKSADATDPVPLPLDEYTTREPEKTEVISDKQPFHMSVYFFSLIMLIIGMLLGVLLVKEFPDNKVTDLSTITRQISTQNPILPSDAVIIEACSTHQGALYIRPGDIPIGPVYMVNKGKLIGLEFMLDKDQFLAGKSFDFLSGLGMKVDHINVGYLANGHAGHNMSHYHVDLYTVSRDVEQGIVCNNSQSSDMMRDMSSSNAASMSVSPDLSPMVSPTGIPSPSYPSPTSMKGMIMQ